MTFNEAKAIKDSDSYSEYLLRCEVMGFEPIAKDEFERLKAGGIQYANYIPPLPMAVNIIKQKMTPSYIDMSELRI